MPKAPSRRLAPIRQLVEVMAALRAPDGCPWDREQTLSSIVPHTLEEAHEVADAIASGSMTAIRDELGDLLFQVVFLARIAEEQGEFAFDDVARAIVDKLVRRHPHVFQHHQSLTSSEQTAAWESMKAAERRADGADGVLAGVGRAVSPATPAAEPRRQVALEFFQRALGGHLSGQHRRDICIMCMSDFSGDGNNRLHRQIGVRLIVVRPIDG